MLLLIDENVPAQVTEVFRDRGHTVELVTDVLASATADQVIAIYGDATAAIVVTWNQKDFRKLAARVSEPGTRYLRRLGRISFRMREPEGRKRLLEVMRWIEMHYEDAERQSDKRLLLEVTRTTFTVR